MYKLCDTCKNRSIEISSSSEIVNYSQWVTENVDRLGAKAPIKVTTKKTIRLRIERFERKILL